MKLSFNLKQVKVYYLDRVAPFIFLFLGAFIAPVLCIVGELAFIVIFLKSPFSIPSEYAGLIITVWYFSHFIILLPIAFAFSDYWDEVVKLKMGKYETKTLTPIESMKLDSAKLTKYVETNQFQSFATFWLACTASVIGFAILGFSFYLGASNQASYAQLSIPLISGLVSQFIGATFLFMYKTTGDQIKDFYISLNNNQKYLVALEMTNELSTQELKDKKIEELISKIIEK